MPAVLAALRLHPHPPEQQSHWHGKWRSSVWCHHNDNNNNTTNNINRINNKINSKRSNTNLADIAFAIGFSRFRSTWKCICRFPISTHSSSVRNVRYRCRCCGGPRCCGFCWTYACNTSCTSQLTTRSQKVSTQQTVNVCVPHVCVCLLRFSHWKLWHAKCVARTNQNSVLHKHEKKATPTTAATKVANQVQKACAQWYTQCEHDCNLTSSKDKASHTDTHKEVFCLPVGSKVFPSLRLCTSVR